MLKYVLVAALMCGTAPAFAAEDIFASLGDAFPVTDGNMAMEYADIVACHPAMAQFSVRIVYDPNSNSSHDSTFNIAQGDSFVVKTQRYADGIRTNFETTFTFSSFVDKCVGRFEMVQQQIN